MVNRQFRAGYNRKRIRRVMRRHGLMLAFRMGISLAPESLELSTRWKLTGGLLNTHQWTAELRGSDFNPATFAL